VVYLKLVGRGRAASSLRFGLRRPPPIHQFEVDGPLQDRRNRPRERASSRC